METILITGGAGFIGTKLVQKLKPKYKIIVLDNFLEQVHGNITKIERAVKYIIRDVANIDSWKKIDFENLDYIIHLAAETGTGQSMDEISRYVRTNVLGTSNMLEMLNKPNSVKKVILASSRAVYGEGENNNLNPISIYGLTKLNQEQLFKISCKVPYTILRYQNVYGPGQSLKNPYTGVLSIFSEQLYEKKDIEIWDKGIPTRDFIYIDDVVEATILAMEKQITNNKIYDVGSGSINSILNIGWLLRYKMGCKCKVKIIDYHRPGDVMYVNTNTNIDKIKEDLNWEPKYTLAKGTDKFVEWFKKEKQC